MKQLSSTIIMFLIIISIFSCKKKSDDTTPTPEPTPTSHEKNDIIISHYWIKSYSSITQYVDLNGDTHPDTTIWQPNYPDSCQADDRYYFKSSGYLVVDPGVVACGASIDSSNWSLLNNEAILKYEFTNHDFVSINTSKMILRHAFSDGSIVDTSVFIYP